MRACGVLHEGQWNASRGAQGLRGPRLVGCLLLFPVWHEGMAFRIAGALKQRNTREAGGGGVFFLNSLSCRSPGVLFSS